MLLFLFGLAIGSFVNVVVARYHPEKPLFHEGIVYKRSHCPKCKATLRWFELIPVVSYVIQGGRCRHCGRGISIEYPIVEAASGFLFFFVSEKVFSTFVFLPYGTVMALAALWIFIFEFLLIAMLIDLRFGIIPDEIEIGIGIVAFVILYLAGGAAGMSSGNFAWSHILGFFIAAAFFGALILFTKGRGMGMGDLKLIAVLGFLFGWPDIVLLMGFAFVLGACVGGALVLSGKSAMKRTIPFGPFIAVAAAIVFFLGADIIKFYFSFAG